MRVLADSIVKMVPETFKIRRGSFGSHTPGWNLSTKEVSVYFGGWPVDPPTIPADPPVCSWLVVRSGLEFKILSNSHLRYLLWRIISPSGIVSLGPRIVSSIFQPTALHARPEARPKKSNNRATRVTTFAGET
eukprot:scaffold44490_cov55-Cyclotella_meneghiniana.AAC.2